jgi:hypothetical protein
MIGRGRDAVRLIHDAEVSCEVDPTRLFLLMNQQLWDKARSHLYDAPVEARTWIGSRHANTDEYRWRNLPLHLACLHGPEPAPLHFIEALIEAYPDGARRRNHEGSTPLHLACECMDLGPRYRLEEEGILIALIRAFPGCLGIRDGRGRTPLEILNERSLGNGLAIIKYMKTFARGDADDGDDERRGREGGVQVSDEGMNHEGRESLRVRSSNDWTKALRHNEAKTRSRSRSAFVNASKEQKSQQRPPNISTEQPHHFFGGDNSMEMEDDLYLDPAQIPRDSQMMNELQQQRDLVESLLQQQKILVESLKRPSDPIPVVSPAGTHPTAMVTPSPMSIYNPSLHQLDSELSSMRNANQTMSLLLSSKTQSENELQECLRKVESAYTQLKKEYADLKAEHSMTVAKMEEKSNEVSFMKSKQKAVTFELALKSDVEERQSKDIDLLKNELTKETEARAIVAVELECQMERCAKLEKIVEVSKNQSEQMSRENEKLSIENKEIRAQLTQKNKQVKETKAKEATLLGLLSHMHDVPSSSSTENLRLLKIIQENKAKETKMKSLLEKAKHALTMSQKKNLSLQMQIDRQTIELEESKATKSELEEQSFELTEELRAKNEELREVSSNAIVPLATLLRSIPKSYPPWFNGNSDSLMSKKAETAPMEGDSNNCMIDASQSLELLRPIVSDAMGFQKDSLGRIELLYQYFHDTMELIGKIPSIPHDRFQFQPTLQILEETVISHVQIMETLDDILETKARHKPNLISLLNEESSEATKYILRPKTHAYIKTDFPEQEAFTSTMVASTKTTASTKKISLARHLDNLERLSVSVAKLPRVSKITLNAKRTDLQLHLKKVDEITTVLDKALTVLVQDARQLKVAHDNNNMEYDTY